MKILRSAVLVFALVFVSNSQAKAASLAIGSIGPDCSTCQGSIYTLDIVGLADTDLKTSDKSFDTYVVKLTIDASGYDGGGVRIDEVGVKISSGVDAAKVTGAPGDASYWNLLSGGIGASGCSGSGAGFECSDWILGSASGAYVPNTSLLTWTFNIDISGPLFDGSNLNLLPSIKVRYVDDNGKKVGALVSETVPEPTTLALLGVGAAVAAFRRRRSPRRLS